MTPLRLIVEATVATAITPPTQGSDRERRRDSRAPPQRATRVVIVMRVGAAIGIPHEG